MADRKISEMTLLAQGDLVSTTDYLPIVDPSEAVAANRNKRILGSSLVLGALSQATSVTIGGTLSETISSVVYPVASQFDVGTAPNQIPLNQYLGTLAWQDAAAVNVGLLQVTQGLFALGTATLPSIAFVGDLDTGAWSPAANTVAVSTGGVERIRWASTGTSLRGEASGGTPANNGNALRFVRSDGQLMGYIGWSDETTSNASWLFRSSNGNPINWSAAVSGVQLTLDNAGNLGLGVTPSAWSSTWKAAQLQGGSVWTAAATDFGLAHNAHYTAGGGWTYTNSAAAARHYMAGATHTWSVAASGTAGTAVTWADAMRLDASGNLGVGTSTFGTSAVKVLSIGTGTEPSTGPADTVQFFSVDRSAGNTIPGIRCEGTGVTDAGITNTTVTNKIAIKVNGTVYYLLATTNAT